MVAKAIEIATLFCFIFVKHLKIISLIDKNLINANDDEEEDK